MKDLNLFSPVFPHRAWLACWYDVIYWYDTDVSPIEMLCTVTTFGVSYSMSDVSMADRLSRGNL